MRMWGVDTSLLCTQHLLGEHLEMHMFVGTIKRGTRLDGYISGGLVDTALIVSRHDTLVIEMTIRGMKHRSPLSLDGRKPFPEGGTIDIEGNIKELQKRCPNCKKRIELNKALKTIRGSV